MTCTASPEGEPLKKHIKLDGVAERSPPFTSGHQIHEALHSPDNDHLVNTLTRLRNQLTVQQHEHPISPQDQRLGIAKEWLDLDPGARRLFEHWHATQRQHSLLTPLVSLLSSLLTLLSSHYPYHAVGLPIVKMILSQHMHSLNSYLSGSHADLILVTLKLLNSVSCFAGGRERKAFLDVFAWDAKALYKLLYMRRRSKTKEPIDPLDKPDIRTLYVLFLLSFVDSGSTPAMKTEFLEQRRDTFQSIFKGLAQDSYSVARKVLEVCWSGIWMDPKVHRTPKIRLFNEATIAHITKLYDRALPEGSEQDMIPADLVHHFLLAICTRPGTGICFQDQAWYPRSADEPTDHHGQKGGRINKILGNVLKILNVNDDARQQELALKIMRVCPELVASYWSGSGLTLDPRLSSKWIINISFFGSVISLPVPISSFLLPGINTYRPTPPPLANVLENVLPSTNIKTQFSKGLQSASALVRHCTALALTKCLVKLHEISKAFDDVARALEEDEDEGQWSRARREITREARRRVPELQVVIAYSQMHTERDANQTRVALLAESAQRLLWMYQLCLPDTVAETTFDFGKLLGHFADESQGERDDGEMMDAEEGVQESHAALSLHALRKLHVLRLLKESDHFTWSGKMPSSSHSYFYTLLNAYNTSMMSETRAAIVSLVVHILSKSILFCENMDEPELWLAALPDSRREKGAESPDKASLTDEGESVIVFLDDCVQRCLRTPHRYQEAMHDLVSSSSLAEDAGRSFPSPLLMTAVEQLDIKLASKLLSSSDVLAIATFLRRLLYALSGEMEGLEVLRALAAKVETALRVDRLFSEHEYMTSAVRRQVSILRFSFGQGFDLHPSNATDANEAFLRQLEHVPNQETSAVRTVTARKLVDWLHFVDPALPFQHLSQLIRTVERLHKPAVRSALENMHPARGLPLEPQELDKIINDPAMRPTFEWLFLIVDAHAMSTPIVRSLLVNTLYKDGVNAHDIHRAVRLIFHRMTSSGGTHAIQADLLSLLTLIMKSANPLLSREEGVVLNHHVFRSSWIQKLGISESLSPTVQKGLDELVTNRLDPTCWADREVVEPITRLWRLRFDALIEAPTPTESALNSLEGMSTWALYLESDAKLQMLDTLGNLAQNVPGEVATRLLGVIMHVLSRSNLEPHDLRSRLNTLLRLRPLAPSSNILESSICGAMEACLPACLDGFCTAGNRDLRGLVDYACDRWWHQSAPLGDADIHAFVCQDVWTDSTARIIASMLYKQNAAGKTFLQWLESGNLLSHSLAHMTVVLYALLDASRCRGEHVPGNLLFRYFPKLLDGLLHPKSHPDVQDRLASCVSLVFSSVSSGRGELSTLLEEQMHALPDGQLSSSLLRVGLRLHDVSSDKNGLIALQLIKRGMQWIIQHLTDEDELTPSVLVDLTNLCEATKMLSSVNLNLVETVLTVIIQSHLKNEVALHLATVLAKSTQMKPLTVNRLLQDVIQHPQFFKVGAIGSQARDNLIGLVQTLFRLHPRNTCHPTHIEPLIRIYGGTLSISDSRLLSIFQLFEAERRVSTVSLLTKWSAANGFHSSNSLDAVRSLDPTQVHRTCSFFPDHVHLNQYAEPEKHQIPHRDAIYNPVFLILMFAHMLRECAPDNTLAWVEVLRTNIIGLMVRALSAEDEIIRELSLGQLTGLWKCLEDVDMQEKLHVMYILSLLKNTLPPPSNQPPPRLPALITLLLHNALRGILYPSSFLFPLTSQFLLQRSELDTHDVPMFYSMLYSNSDDWKRQRVWIIRSLVNGMVSTDDWATLKRRRTWEVLASLFEASQNDHTVRTCILELLAKITSNVQATKYLISKGGFLSWTEAQLRELQENESLAWAKILENILVVVEHTKHNSLIGVPWHAAVCNCLSLLLNNHKSGKSILVFALVARIMLRLSLLTTPPTSVLFTLVDSAVERLKDVESVHDILLSSGLSQTARSPADMLPSPMHDGNDLLGLLDPKPAQICLWGQSVEYLWRTFMNIDDDLSTISPAFGALTSRLLLWRAMTGDSEDSVGEWARKETVRLANKG